MPTYPPTVAHALRASADRLPDELAIRTHDDTVRWTWRELEDRVRAGAQGLKALGVRPGDRVGLLMVNRPDFHVADLAAVLLGATPFSIYYTYAPEQIEFVMGDAGATTLITERDALDRALQAGKNLPDLRHIVVLDENAADAAGGVHTWSDVLEAGRAAGPLPDDALNRLDPSALATLIYTSGTTGDPKGVSLTHHNIAAAARACEGRVAFPEGSRVISWLPAAHIAERIAHHYLPVIFGGQITCCPDPSLIAAQLPVVRPTWFFAVPRVWEKIKASLESNLPAPALAAIEAGVRKVRLEQTGQAVPDDLARQVAEADTALFAPLRQKLGLDQARTLNVGAAPTPPEVLEFFHAIGLPVSELWGMSETTAAGCSNPPERIKIGTVGTAAPGIEIKLGNDDEVLLRGDVVTAGYHNQPGLTGEAIIDGWLHTGDIGRLDEDGYLTIVDRKKELIINAMGKNMSPALIESRLKAASPLIGQACCIGDAKHYNTALIVLDPDGARGWATQHDIQETELPALAGNDQVQAAVQEGIDAANARLSRVEQIKKFTIVPGDWLPSGDELTPTMKLKRRVIADKYADLIDSMYR